jgi:hypothetical protein
MAAGAASGLTANEAFWLDVIRAASGFRDPSPTLAMTQALRLLFSSAQAGTGSIELAVEAFRTALIRLHCGHSGAVDEGRL